MRILFLLCILCMQQLSSQRVAPPAFFEQIDREFPHHPAGLSAAVSWEHCRWEWIGPNMPEACNGKPIPIGFMGWLADGKGLFRENADLVEDATGIPFDSLLTSPQNELRAWHKALDAVLDGVQDPLPQDWLWAAALISYIPSEAMCGSTTPLAFWLDEVLRAWAHLGGPEIKLEELIPEGLPESLHLRSGNDPLAAWNPAPSCNYNSRQGVPPSAITIHTMQGSFAGTIAWFQHCPSNVSCHYLVRSSDGYLLQMVDEADRAWHVGTENNYTIGIEHEGFVSNPAWYTDSMYVSSAGLSRRIAVRHGIDTLRTAWWPWAAATQYRYAFRPGSCTRTKGHQHYPNQTHTDPGLHWNWMRYARSMAQIPTPLDFGGASGQWSYPVSGSYPNDDLRAWRITVPSGRVRLSFTHFDTESDWDYLMVYDGSDALAPLLGSFDGQQLPGPIESSGNSLYVLFLSDCATQRTGFSCTWQQLNGQPGDSIAPQTQIPQSAQWISADFNQMFLDSDAGGSGLHQTFWLAASYDGLDYKGNTGKGMLAEFFDGPPGALHSGWSILSGSWQQGSGRVVQQQTIPQAIISMPLQQQAGGRFYSWRSALHNYQGQGSASFYFLADSSAGPGRNHSLRLYWDVNGQARLDRCSQGQCSPLMTWQTAIQAGQTHHWLVASTDSTVRIWLDGAWLGEAAYSPLLGSKTWVSIEAANSVFALEELLSGPQRSPSQPIWVQTQAWPPGHLPNPNPNPTLPAGKIMAFATDKAGNMGSLEELTYHMDFTPPSIPPYVLDGIFSDVDTLHQLLRPGSWGASDDPHSGLAAYQWCLGNVPGQCNLVAWQSLAGAQSINQPMALTEGNWTFLSVRAENQAGLLSGIASSNGAVYVGASAHIENQQIQTLRVWPNPFTGEIHLKGKGMQGRLIRLLDMQGREVKSVVWPLDGDKQFSWIFERPAPGVYILHIEGIPALRVICSGIDNF